VGALGERAGAEEGSRTFTGQAPIVDALGLVELAGCDWVGHTMLLVNALGWGIVAKLDFMYVMAPKVTVIQPSKALRYVLP
jgi:hypothetical protein